VTAVGGTTLDGWFETGTEQVSPNLEGSSEGSSKRK